MTQITPIPSRAIVTRSGSILRGYIDNMPFEGPNERDGLLVMLSDPQFKRVTAQPYEVRYSLNNKVRTHYPDALAERFVGPDLVLEIKPDRYIDNAKLIKRTALMKHIFAQRGQQYEVMFSSHIRQEPRYSNAKELYYFSAGYIDDNVRLLTIDLVDNFPGITVGSLSSELNLQDNGAVFTMIGQKLIDFDRNHPLSKSSRLYPMEGVMRGTI